MKFPLPSLGKDAISLPHFPTHHQAFIFRACEYVPFQKIAEILDTTEENVRLAAQQMGLPDYAPGDLWLKKGYITIIRNLWHILPYSQLLQLLGMDEETLATILREEDFLDLKLGDKPICETVRFRALTPEELIKTEKIREIMASLSFAGAAPFDFRYEVPHINFQGQPRFETRMIYGFSGLYLRAFDVDSREFFPDEQLEAYQALGINGIWTQGVLTQLTEFPYDPAISHGYEKRLQRMKELTQRLDKYGIKLYLYLNEPRSMPLAFFDKFPHLKGHTFKDFQNKDGASLCTAVPEVQEYLRSSVETICRQVPLLGGFFTITRAENYTNCYCHCGTGKRPACNCPRCSQLPPAEAITRPTRCILEGVRRVSKDMKVFAWTWAWPPAWEEEAINLLPDDVILLSQSEQGIPCEFGGTQSKVSDYSMSIPGPGQRAKTQWQRARSRGLQVGAKVQVNTTWEASTVPAIPVAPSIEEHMQRLQQENVRHVMLSWTLGGYPCRNLAAAAKYFYEVCDYQGDDSYPAQRQFSEAFREFPFNISVLYRGPQNAGPSTLLFEEPTGYHATMTCYAYDDLESWRAVYPTDVFETQFEKLCTKWEQGLAMLPANDNSETAIMAKATYCLFRSSLNQIRFIRARDEHRYSDALCAAESELVIAQQMLELMNRNAAIGYEAANHYYFSKGQIAEKIINCRYIIDCLQQKDGSSH